MGHYHVAPPRLGLSRWRSGLVLVFWIFLLFPAGLAACAEDAPTAPGGWGVERADPIDNGFFFWNGRYVRAPYTVERWGLDIFINGILVSRGPRPPVSAPSEDPGEPPPGAGPCDSFFSQKWRYLSSRCGRDEATLLMLAAYRKCAGFSVEPAEADGQSPSDGEPSPASTPAVLKVTERGTGEETYITLSDSWKMTRSSPEESLAGRTARKQYYEQFLRRNRVVSLFDGGEHIMAGSDASTALGVLLSKETAQGKIRILERRGILKPGDTPAQCIVTAYREDAQLTERCERLLRCEPPTGRSEERAESSEKRAGTAGPHSSLLTSHSSFTPGYADNHAQEVVPSIRTTAPALVLALVPCVLVLLLWRRRARGMCREQRIESRASSTAHSPLLTSHFSLLASLSSLLSPLILVACVPAIALHAAGTGPAFSPKSNQIETWEPYAWSLRSEAIDNIIANIDGSRGDGQGYTLRRRLQDKSYGLDAAACTPAAFGQVAAGNGVVCLLAHSSGPGDSFSAVGFGPDNPRNAKSRNAARKLATAWRKSLAARNGTRVSWRPDLDVWSVDVNARWVAANWAPACRSNRAITVLLSCYSAFGRHSLMEAAGGRFRVGWADAPSKYPADMDLLFKRLCGAASDGSLRISDDAARAGGFADAVRFGSDGPTTLGPAVRYPPAENVSPWGPGAGYAGTGHIVFDTYCDDSVPAVLALSFAIGGAIQITNVEWERDQTTGKAYKIRFDYAAAASSSYIVWGRANADEVTAEGGGGQKLTGESLAPDQDWPANPGDFTWFFAAQ